MRASGASCRPWRGTLNCRRSSSVLREAAVGLFTTGFMEEFAQRVRDSEYRQLFRETVPAPVQEALLSRCGDRYPAELDYESLDTTIDYPCSLELPEEQISAAAFALQTLPRFRPALQVRFADNQTALTDLQDSTPIVLESLMAIRERKPRSCAACRNRSRNRTGPPFA